MEPKKLHLKISGPLLSKILHERHKGESNCGTLFGEIISQTRNEITDFQHTTESEAFVCIQDYFPRSSRSILKKNYDQQAFGCDSHTGVSCVGNFRVGTSSMQMSLLEKSMHRKLLRIMKAQSSYKAFDFIVTLLIKFHANQATTSLSWTIAAYVLHNGSFTPIRIEISNLQGSVSGLYTTNPSPVCSVQSKSAKRLLHSFKTSLTDERGILTSMLITRNTTEDLINKLGDAFTNLQKNEEILEQVLQEKCSLLDEWNALREKKRKILEPMKTEMSNMAIPVVHGINEANVSSVHKFQAPAKLDKKNFGLKKMRSSIEEDPLKRSPVVVLEKLDVDENYFKMQHAVSSKNDFQTSDTNDNTIPDPFANLVMSAKEKLGTETCPESMQSKRGQDQKTGIDQTHGTGHDYTRQGSKKQEE